MLTVDSADNLATGDVLRGIPSLVRTIEELGWSNPFNPNPLKMLEHLNYVNGKMRVNRLSFGFRYRDGREAGDVVLYREGDKVYAQVVERIPQPARGSMSEMNPLRPGAPFSQGPISAPVSPKLPKSFTIEL